MAGVEQEEFQQFQNTESGSSDCVPVQGGSIKKGAYCMLKGFPCKVSDTAVSKPGKHGAAKIHVTGVDIFTGKKVDDIFSTGGTAWAPVVTKLEYEVADIDEDGFVSLLDGRNELMTGYKLPVADDEREMLTKCWDEFHDNQQVFFTLISAKGQSKFIACRTKGANEQ